MKTENYLHSLIVTRERTDLTEIAEEWEKTCKNCHPITPLACMTNCRIWNQKNEFRRLCEQIKNPNYITKLLNSLKNKRRFQILKIVSKGRHSTAQLQQELKKLGYHHSQRTITNEYLTPLIEVGLVQGSQENQYYLTMLGFRINDLTENFLDIAGILPPHSQCYEETALNMLIRKPQRYEDFKIMIPPMIVARVLNRLQKSRLIEASKGNDYIFYFKTKRNPDNAKFSLTEKRVYENISVEGISARKLAEKTEISLRRTYKYLRRLKGKKMVFARVRPKSYMLTAKGFQAAKFLKEIQCLAGEILATASPKLKDENHRSPLLGTLQIKNAS
jgi:predicted transcriptional regulator